MVLYTHTPNHTKQVKMAGKKAAPAEKPVKEKEEVVSANDADEKKAKVRKPTIAGSQFGKKFEAYMSETHGVDVKACDVMQALFETIKTITEETIHEADANGMLTNVAQKGVSINMPGFDNDGQNFKNTIRFDVKLAKSRKDGHKVPRMTMALHAKYKDSLMENFNKYFESAIAIDE